MMDAMLAEGAQRLADAALRTNGGRTVLLRMSAPASVGDDSEQLGLATPGFNDVVLGPVVFHKDSDVKQLVVSATAVNAALGASGVMGSPSATAADVLFKTAAGVVIDGVLWEITDSYAAEASGQAYVYWLTLRRPVR
jgi:hypothetical protein